MRNLTQTDMKHFVTCQMVVLLQLSIIKIINTIKIIQKIKINYNTLVTLRV